MPAEANKIWAMEDDCVRDWSALPTDVLGYVSKFLTPLIEDFMAFRGVCTSWREAATTDKFVSTRKVPLLMLAEKGGGNVREFYSLAKRKICMTKRLSGAKGKRCIDVGFGWILTLAPEGDVCLLKPFTGEKRKLPNIKTFPEYKKIRLTPAFHFITQAALTADPSKTLNYTVLMAPFRHLGFWRNGGKKWVRINTSCITMVYCKGKMHTVESLTGHVLTWDPLGTDLKEPQGRVKVNSIPTHLHGDRRHYLVVSTEGELLLIERNNTCPEKYIPKGADHFGVMRVDLVKGECTEINDLGNDAIFLGDSAVAVDATEFPGVLKPNCIYFADDCHTTYYYTDGWFKGGGKDTGIYSFKDRSIERFDVNSFSRICPPLWVFP